MKHSFYTFLVFAFIIVPFVIQAQTEFKLNAAALIPQEQGFFLGGVSYDFNDDGLEDYINGCPGDFDFEDYERRDPFHVIYDLHNETGTQQGYTFKNCMILSKCDQKYESTLEPAISKGFIQIRPLIDTSDVELKWSYILSPEIRNIRSITMETSPDVHIQPDRRLIPYNIEVSKDGGLTFSEDIYLSDVVQSDMGYRVTYDAESNEDFADIQSISKNFNVVLRFTSNYDESGLGAYKGQYVKIHQITIVADSAAYDIPVINSADQITKDLLRVQNGKLSAINGPIKVYNLSGMYVGGGESVTVNKGLYIVMTSDLKKHKIFIR